MSKSKVRRAAENGKGTPALRPLGDARCTEALDAWRAAFRDARNPEAELARLEAVARAQRRALADGHSDTLEEASRELARQAALMRQGDVRAKTKRHRKALATARSLETDVGAAPDNRELRLALERIVATYARAVLTAQGAGREYGGRDEEALHSEMQERVACVVSAVALNGLDVEGVRGAAEDLLAAYMREKDQRGGPSRHEAMRNLFALAGRHVTEDWCKKDERAAQEPRLQRLRKQIERRARERRRRSSNAAT